MSYWIETDDKGNMIADPAQIVVRVGFTIRILSETGDWDRPHPHQELPTEKYVRYQEAVRGVEEKLNHDIAHAKRIRDRDIHALKEQTFGQGDLEIDYAYPVAIFKDRYPNEKLI